MQTVIDLGDGEEREISFVLGVGRDVEDVHTLLRRFRGVGAARSALNEVRRYWGKNLGVVQVNTPDPSIDVLMNGWLLYQVQACRLWARSGFYQSGGAFGFRDQLQDAMALVHSDPATLRAHILRAAARQFREGDVQHWWHPPSGRGVRTHFSDDYLWLPLAVCRYVLSIGDTGVLDVRVPFIEGRQVKPDEESYFDQPVTLEESATLYEHCVRAIQHGFRYGQHGLPLMGCGDWNDGMNLVGEYGRGESVWLGFFLYDVLGQFGEVALRRGDDEFVSICKTNRALLQKALEQHAWDGDWYRRAYFDDGRPLGSATNTECQIDSLPQSWSVLSGAADPARAKQAMAEMSKHLVDRENRLVKLFEPPFDNGDMNPGYIKGYVPGVRENGGQYTHAAIWSAMAFAALGDNEKAWELVNLINPVSHGNSPATIATYKVEPYVMTADVYVASAHIGRGGWSWYTGAAGWTYRLILESLLGIRLDIDQLHFAPCVPADWKTFDVHYKYRGTEYHIVFQLGAGTKTGRIRISLDGQAQQGETLRLVDDRVAHNVEVHWD
jgi:cellobiose phosphorylase